VHTLSFCVGVANWKPICGIVKRKKNVSESHRATSLRQQQQQKIARTQTALPLAMKNLNTGTSLLQ